jgi:hypothetical protein
MPHVQITWVKGCTVDGKRLLERLLPIQGTQR